jgi:hypothetical protein
LHFVAKVLDVVTTRGLHSSNRYTALGRSAIHSTFGSARMLAARQFPLACFLAILPDWFSTAGYLDSVAAMRHHFVNKLGAWGAALVALALAEVAAGQ